MMLSIQSVSLPPGPRGAPIIGMLRPFMKDPLGTFVDGARQYGDVVRFRVGPHTGILIHRPEHLKHVLVDNAHNYVKGRVFQRLEPLLGRGLLTTYGDFWRRERRIMQPSFHREQIALLTSEMITAIENTIARLKERSRRGPIDVVPELSAMTLSVVCRTLFHADISRDTERVGRSLTRALEEISRRIVAMAQIPLSIPTPSNISFRAAIRVLHKVVDEFIEQRRTRKQEHQDLLSMLLDARDPETGEGLNDQQIRDEVITLMVAGHETTATALSWALYLVAKHPAVQERLRREVTQVIGDAVPSFADVPKLRFTTMVLEEAMRLYPPVWGLARDPIAPDIIGGYRVPPGCSVYMQTYITHRRGDVWERPDEFDPDRFEPSRAANRHPFAFLPFGAGQHKCIGAHFAMTEGVLALAMFARAFGMKLASNAEIEPAPRVTLRPDREVLIELSPSPAA